MFNVGLYNMPAYALGIVPWPHADATDGRGESAAARGRREYLRLMRGHRNGLIHSAWRQAELESTTPIQIDGDPYPAGPLRVRMDPAALRVLTPVMP
jgi:hypothetical protein